MTHTPTGLIVAVLDPLGSAEEVVAALQSAGAIAFATTDPKEAAAADGLVIPGGADFGETVKALGSVQGARVVGQRLAGARPVLAIGTAMQVLFEHLLNDDSTTPGLGEWPGDVEKLQCVCDAAVVDAAPGSEMLHGVEGELAFGTEFGVLDFALQEDEFIAYPRLSWADCGGQRVLAAVENGALWAAQFHPERSGGAGARVFANWLAQLG